MAVLQTLNWCKSPQNVPLFIKVQVSIYIESQVVCPLADNLVTRVADIRQLVLEDVITTRSVSIFIEHHPGSCTACLMETEFR